MRHTNTEYELILRCKEIIFSGSSAHDENSDSTPLFTHTQTSIFPSLPSWDRKIILCYCKQTLIGIGVKTSGRQGLAESKSPLSRAPVNPLVERSTEAACKAISRLQA